VSPNVALQLKWGTTKVAKPIKVQLTQGVATLTSDVVLRAILECNKAKFLENFTICMLNGIESILGNTIFMPTMLMF